MRQQGLIVTRIEMAEAKARVKPVVDSFCAKSANVKQVVDYFNDYRARNKK
jgi:hypothetical protein